jgi:UDP-N-acetylmuramate dehydrogenase
MIWWKRLNGVERDCPLGARTTWRIGGRAEFLLHPASVDELRQACALARENGVRVLVLGRGSNILVADGMVKGLVVCLDGPAFSGIQRFGTAVVAGAGVPLARLLSCCRRWGLGGLEFLTGIPGTVGGACALNAGVTVRGAQKAIGDCIECVWVLDYNNTVRLVEARALAFSYRTARLGSAIVLAARFGLRRRACAAIAKDIAGFRARRMRSQDWRLPSAGCVFKNPSGDSAGRLIDSCGLKGRRIGGAVISAKHANFILNTGTASCADVLALMRLARQQVQRRYRIRLEPEIRLWK